MMYTILGDPSALARHRYTGKQFCDKQLLKQHACRQLENQHGTLEFYKGSCHLDITFHIRIPKVSLKKMREVEGRYHITTPILADLINFALKAASHNTFEEGKGVLMHDDCIVSSISAKKIYAIEPKTVFTLVEV